MLTLGCQYIAIPEANIAAEQLLVEHLRVLTAEEGIYAVGQLAQRYTKAVNVRLGAVAGEILRGQN